MGMVVMIVVMMFVIMVMMMVFVVKMHHSIVSFLKMTRRVCFVLIIPQVPQFVIPRRGNKKAPWNRIRKNSFLLSELEIFSIF